MAHRIPIFKDDHSFVERQGKVWSDIEWDLERRRCEWEDEIERMRKDFFTLKPDEDHQLESITDKFKMGDSLENEARGVVEKDKSGCLMFCVRFNVQSYQPNEVSVKIDLNKLIVHAKHEEKSDNKSLSREYNREVNIPCELDPLSLQCSISTDGILTIKAPMLTPQYNTIKDVGTLPKEHVIQASGAHSTPPLLQPQQKINQSQLSQQQKQPNHSSTYITFLSGTASQPSKFQLAQEQSLFQTTPQNPPYGILSSVPLIQQNMNTVGSILESDRKFKVDVDIEDFSPEELSVKTIDQRLVISAHREEKLANRTLTKELNREIYLPDMVDPYSVKAFFSDSGKLIVEAPYIRSMPISHYGNGYTNIAGH